MEVAGRSYVADGPVARLSQDPIRTRSSRILAANFDRAPLRQLLDQVVGIWGEDGGRGEGGDTGAGAGSARLEKKLRTLRWDIEREKIKENRAFLASMSTLAKDVSELESHMTDMMAQSRLAQERMRVADESCLSLIEQANILYQRREKIAVQRSVTEAFLARFSLTAEETAVLTKASEAVSPEMLDALIRSRQIHEDCKALLNGENQTAGLSIMEQMTSYQKSCYDRLTTWFEQQIQAFSNLHTLDVRPLQRKVVDQIRRSPVHLEKMITALIRVRRQALLNSFNDALVYGTETGARPMELHAHEPARYAGDMLAWIHQALANEREFLDALMGSALASDLHKPSRTTSSDQGPRDDEMDEKTIAKRLAQVSISQDGTEEWGLQALVDQNISAVNRPFKMRMQQIITTQQGNLALHKIANIIRFYKGFIANTLGAHSSLSNLLQELASLATATFFKEVSVHGDNLLSALKNEPVLPTMEPTSQILQCSHLLREVVMDHRTWLPAADDGQGGGDGDELESIMAAIFSNSRKLLEYSCATLSSSLEQRIYKLNSLQLLKGAFAGLGRASATHATLKEMIQDEKIGLTDLHSTQLLIESGLAPVQDAMQGAKQDSILSRCKGCESEDVRRAMQAFTAFLGAVDPSTSIRLQKLLSSATASEIHRQALRIVAERYRWIVDRVLEPASRYEFASTLLQVDASEAASLLGVSRP